MYHKVRMQEKHNNRCEDMEKTYQGQRHTTMQEEQSRSTEATSVNLLNESRPINYDQRLFALN